MRRESTAPSGVRKERFGRRVVSTGIFFALARLRARSSARLQRRARGRSWRRQDLAGARGSQANRIRRGIFAPPAGTDDGVPLTALVRPDPPRRAGVSAVGSGPLPVRRELP